MVNIILAGMNFDLEALAANDKIMTPETIAAAYARISRNPEAVNELRVKAREDVEAARKSVTNITHDMGHSSIAEHIVFNFDVLGLSRKAIELLESHRLNAYTEKSQRYITLDGDYVIPKELEAVPELKERFIQIIENQNSLYNQAFPKINEMLLKKYSAGEFNERFKEMNILDEKAQKRTIEGWAKEDARYCLSMATEGQLGMTVNGRNLERMITEFRSSPIAEARELGDKLFAYVDGVAPSLIKYTEPTDYYQKTREKLANTITNMLKESQVPKTHSKSIINSRLKLDSNEDCSVGKYTLSETDDTILAGLVFSSTNLLYVDCIDFISRLSDENKKEIVKNAVNYQKSHDPKLREWELGGYKNIYEITLSSSAFAQLKRHRMNTVISQAYDPLLGLTIPKNIKDAGFEESYQSLAEASDDFYWQLKKDPKTAPVADYVLTNMHNRRVLLAFNERQLHAIANERMNLFAQWDIRKLMTDMVELANKDSPITSGTACGKHEYDSVKGRYCSE